MLQGNFNNHVNEAAAAASISLTSNRMGNSTIITNTQKNVVASPSECGLETHQPTSKKRRNLPGNPDPEADVVALSPKSLMEKNRFVCEVCNKGFQRDQNLQLHRRGHNLPWKLKQRNKNIVVKRKVYICPEPSCVHHDPSRALGDLTGIKKHFSRKHGEKKYKCDKCSKRYAVQSDWKAHSKICGTREYRCDCGTLFSRRDSFITHRAFCDALAEESSRSMSTQQNPMLFSAQSQQNHRQILHNNSIQLKQETHRLPPWLSSCEDDGVAAPNPPFTPSVQKLGNQLSSSLIHENPNYTNNNNIFPSILSSHSSSLMSATALLQKASQMGVTVSKHQSSSDYHHQQQLHHVAGSHGFASSSSFSNITAGVPSREGLIWHGLRVAPFGNNNMQLQGKNTNAVNYFLPSTSSSSSTFDMENFDGLLNAQGENVTTTMTGLSNNKAAGPGNNEGLTKDFLGLRAFPHDRNYFTTINMSGLDQMGSSSSSSAYDQQQARDDKLQWQS